MTSEDRHAHAVPRQRGSGAVGRCVGLLPDRLPLILLGFIVVANILILTDAFFWWLLLPLGAIASAGAWFLASRIPTEVHRRTVIGAILALVVAVVWVVGNAPFAAQLFDVTRDPAIYTLEGVWLSRNPHVGISVQDAQSLVQGLQHFSWNLGVFTADDSGNVLSQGGDALPAMLAIGAWFDGLQGLTVVNIGIGGLGLIAVYALGRRLIGPIWALLPMVAIGLSLPYMYFSRAPYSEIIMIVVACAGLSLLIGALRGGRWEGYALAGALLGSATMARVDGTIAVIGAMVVLILARFGFIRVGGRRHLRSGTIAFSVAACVTTALGAIDLIVNKPSYLATIRTQSYALWAATVLLGVIAVVAEMLGRRWSSGIGERSRRVLAWVLGAVTAVMFLFWLSRPLWYVGEYQGTATQAQTALLQRADGLRIDGRRSYEEQTLAWLGWYFGWPMVAAAVVGFVVAIVDGVRRRRAGILTLVIVTVGAAVVYFDRVSITPDQVWAFRRILPIVTSGFLIVATSAVVWLWGRRRRWVRVGAVLLAASIVTGPLWVINGVVLVPEGESQRAEIAALCGAITTDDVLYITDNGPVNYAYTIRTVCNVNVVSGTAGALDEAELQTLRERAGGSLDVVTFDRDALTGSTVATPPFESTTVRTWDQSIDSTPDSVTSTTRSIWLGTVNTLGEVVIRR